MSVITTAANLLTRLFAANATAASYTDPAPTETEPTGAGVITVAAGGTGAVPDNIFLVPFGVGAAGQQFNLRIHGWQETANGLWVPLTLLEVSCLLGTKTGAGTNADVPSTNKFCDTLGLLYGLGGVEVLQFSPSNNLMAGFVFDLMGSSKYQVEVKVVSATSGNALGRGL